MSLHPLFTQAALGKVERERDAQDAKWGDQVNHSDLYWLGILVEEVGELAKGIIETYPDGMITKELTQLAAVAVGWLEARMRRGAT